MLLLASDGIAQNLSSLGNYAGLATISNNPSLTVFSRLQSDINIISVNVAAFNNSLYMQQGSKQYDIARHQVKQTKLFIDAEVSGPGILLTGRTHAVAFKTSFKTITCANGIREETSAMAYHEIIGKSEHNVAFGIADGKQFNVVSYGELAINYSKIMRNNGSRMTSFGYTGKLISGFMATSLSAEKSSIHNGTENNTFTTANIRYAYAMPDPNNKHSLISMRGIGIGTDIGFTYLKKRFAKTNHKGCPSVIKRYLPVNNYNWKFSIAILDIGGIMFQNEARDVQLSSLRTEIDTVSLKGIGNNYQFDSLLAQRAGQVSRKGSFYVGLPTTVVVQFDKYINRQFFIHYYLMQRLITDNGIRMFKANQLSISPRYETANWEAGVKLGVTEYTFPTLGASLRFKSFSIGADYITDLSFTSVYGAQLNMGLAIHRVREKRMPKMRF